MKLKNSRMKKIWLTIAFAGFILFLVMNYTNVFSCLGFIIGILTPFLFGAAIAFVVNIPMRFMERTLFKKFVAEVRDDEGNLTVKRRGFVRPLCVVITLVLVAAVVTAVVAIVVPQLATAVEQLVRSASASLPKFQKWADEIFRDNSMVKDFIDSWHIDVKSIMSNITQFLQNGAGSAFSSALGAAQTVVSGVFTVVIGVIFASYLLGSKEKLQKQAKMVMHAAMPDKASDYVTRVAKLCSETFSKFIAGQGMEMCIICIMFFIVLSIAQIPYAGLVSVLIAFMSLIPFVGMFLGCAISAVIILMENPISALIFVVIFIVLQQIEGNLIYPRVVGSRVGLPPMWVIVAVTIGSSLFGIAGVLLFIPLTSVIYQLVREWVLRRLKAKREKEQLLSAETEKAAVTAATEVKSE